jgi:hypothetical protein
LQALLAAAVAIPAVAVSTVQAHGATEAAPPTLLAFSFLGTPTMLVDPSGGPSDGPGAAIAGNTNTFQPPSKVTIHVPPGYPIATGAPGTTLGAVAAIALDENKTLQTATELQLFGPVTAGDPAHYPPDSPASACDPRPHTAVWSAELSALGLDLAIPIFVDAGASPAESAQLVFCAPVPSTSDGTPTNAAPLPIGLLQFSSLVGQPSGSTTYTLSAEVVPLGPDLRTAAPSEAYEVRTALPARLTLTGPKKAKTYEVTLHGRLTLSGRPLAKVDVDIGNLNQNDPAADITEAKTDKAGRFSVQLPITRTTRFLASAFGPLVLPCPTPSTQPRGCASLTVPSSPVVGWTVRVTS